MTPVTNVSPVIDLSGIVAGSLPDVPDAPVVAEAEAEAEPKPTATEPTPAKVNPDDKKIHAAVAAKDSLIMTGIAKLASVIEAEVYAGGNVWTALAQFAEDAKIAGNKDACRATLRKLADNFDRFVMSSDEKVRERIRRLADKDRDKFEHSNAVSAMCAGSVLVYYAKKAKAIIASTPEMSGYTRAVQRLWSPCAAVREGLKAPVSATWNGDPKVDLDGVLERASTTQKKANEQGSAGRVTDVRKGASAPAVTAPTAGTLVPATGSVPHIPTAAIAGTASWARQLQIIEAACAELLADKATPDVLRAGVSTAVATITDQVAEVRQMYVTHEHTSKPANPADVLSLMN